MRNTLVQLWKILDKKNRLRVFGVLGITIASTFFEMLGITLIIPVVAMVITPSDTMEDSIVGELLNKIASFLGEKTFVIGLVLLAVVFLIKSVILILCNYMQVQLACSSRFDAQKRLLHSYITRPYDFYLTATTGDVVRVIYTDTNQTFDLLLALTLFVSESCVSIGLIITIFLVDWKMAVFVAVMLIIISTIIVAFVRPKMKKEGQTYHLTSTKMYNWLIEIIGAIKEIKVSRNGAYFDKQFEINGKKRAHSEKMSMFMNNLPRTLVETSFVVFFICYILVRYLLGDDLSKMIVSLSAFAMAAVKLMPGANRIIGAINSISYNRPAVAAVYNNLCSRNEDMVDTRLEKVVNHYNQGIEIKNLFFCYPDTDKLIFDSTEVSIEKGSTIGIVGPSGAGKTTLVDILLGLLKPQKGDFVVDGAVNNVNDEKIIFNAGYIPQNIFLLDDSIMANVAFGVDKSNIDEARVKAVIHEAQLDQYVDSLPDGLETQIGERGIRLSGGQRQRIGIARALYNNTELLIFDEATSALDDETEQAVMNAINMLKGRKTIVIIAHRTNTLKDCDYIYRVNGGKITKEDNIYRN